MQHTTFYEFLSRLRNTFLEPDRPGKYANELPPLRSELFSAAQMEQYGRALAKVHKTETGRAPNTLLTRLSENEKLLNEVRNLLADAVKSDALITPAGEWLLDNFYLVEEHIRAGKQHLPKGYSEGLPRLIEGPSAGLPRVYDIALEIIAHSDGRIDINNISSFIEAYQEVSVLKLGELWAIPIMLRLALIENLRRVSARIAVDKVNQQLADQWSDLMIETAEKDPKSLILVIADMARSGPPMESSFVAELTRQLMWKGPALTLPLTWVEQRLAEINMTTARLVDMENQKQAADQVSISNTIGSLRFVSTMDWREFVETMSSVEQVLRKDPSGVYGKMDFATRDHYRHVVEHIAKFSTVSEADIADIAFQLANKYSTADEHDKRKHVGYFLIDKGLNQTEALAGMKLPFMLALKKFARTVPLTIYATAIFILTATLSAGLLLKAYNEGAEKWVLAALAVLIVTGTSQLAIAVVNWLATLWVRPDLLPRLDLSKEIPPEFRTLVVVPSMIADANSVLSLAEGLEIRFLANRKKNLSYALLTDFTDAKQEEMPEDDALLLLSKEVILELNKKYSNDEDIFFLFHRPRKWQPQDKIWMGYERKRGKLGALNSFLLSGDQSEFQLIAGDIDVLRHVRYVITLDTDTQLPREAAWKMIATMAHPLNHAVYSEKHNRVTEGYGILQPRVCVNMPWLDSSLYVRLHANDTGVDPYTRLTSDVYQDVFHEGSFIGKGIYDVAIFEKALNDRFPENRILSHDLIEGCYLRSGLASDIQLYEENPAKFSTDVNRRHRWIRGDWQVGWWCLPIVPDAHKRLHKNPLSPLSRWKIFDNLRRSLVPVSLVLILVAGAVVLKNPVYWMTIVAAIIALPSFIASLWSLIRKPKNIMWMPHLVFSVKGLVEGLLLSLFALACLPFEAYYTLDAIIRTGWRMIISHNHLLQWKPSGSLDGSNDNTLGNAYLSMWANPLAAIALGVYVRLFPVVVFAQVIPLLIVWLGAPAVTWWVSRRSPGRKKTFTQVQFNFLKHISRKTWAYFERFVNEEENWLPPDNYQEQPKEKIAHRTSPTNVGLALLSNLSAYDFGYITGGQLVKRTTNTLDAMGKLERMHGHFYNWYDTLTLQPLPPRYISSVDSGNLAGHLLILKQGLLEMPDQKLITLKTFDGLVDTLDVLESYVPDKIASLHTFRDKLTQVLGAPLNSMHLLVAHIRDLQKVAGQVVAAVDEKADGDSQWWANALQEQCTAIMNELVFAMPWIVGSDQPDMTFLIQGIPTLRELAELSIESGSYSAEHRLRIVEHRDLIDKAAHNAQERIGTLIALADQCEDFADIAYDFLYDKAKHLLAIGYNVEEQMRDASCYDLLASEARLSNFVAIAQDKLPQESWFALGRSVTDTGDSVLLLSWSGSMFEYLMPLLVMPTYEQTLLHQTYRSVIAKQIDYGKKNGVPWGISESGYNRVDAAQNYQYKAFGVPGTGLKRGLGDDLVVAPYASVMALMVMPEEACENMQELAKLGYEGRYGFYEAIDYTPSRLPRGNTSAVIESFMVHHLGMSLLSLSYLLHDRPMQRRFRAELRFQASLLLLQEKVPRVTVSYAHTVDVSEVKVASGETEMRYISTPDTPVPEIQLLSNGNYNVMISNSGGGYSRWKDIAVTRWREDAILDNWGTFCYISDVENNITWSNTHQPTLAKAKMYEAVFSQGRAEFKRFDHNIETHTEVVVSPEDDIELRRIKITNRSRRRRTLEITSYAEIVLNSQPADEIHPAFGNLFIQTEIQQKKYAIVCTRRPRSADQQPPWMCHMMKLKGVKYEEVSFETSRKQFIGRGNSMVLPDVVSGAGKMSGNEGSVLDPVVAVRYKITLEPGGIATLDMVNGISETKEGCQALIDKYQDKHLRDRVLELSWTHSQVVLRQINATESDAQLYGQMASSILYMNPLLRTDPVTMMNNFKGQPGLWGYAVSGDVPIVLLKIREGASIGLVKQMVQAHAYWRMKGLVVDLVIWNEDHGGYRQTMHDELSGMISAGAAGSYADKPGGIFLRTGDQISKEDRILFETVARVVISDDKGSLADQVNRKSAVKTAVPYIDGENPPETIHSAALQLPDNIEFFNETGGFSADGRSYVIVTDTKRRTPAPWVNVIANPNFGTVISECGQSYTWIENAHEQRLTPWYNDPVCDTGGEQIYLRDDETGYIWSAAGLPVPSKYPYITEHHQGYSIFRHTENGIYSELCVFVDTERAVKFNMLRLRNESGRSRKISVTGYAEWLLGDRKGKSVMHIVTEHDAATGAIYGRNTYSPEFGSKVAFFDTDDTQGRTYTCDRNEFTGRNGTLSAPDGMRRIRFSNRAGAGYDACAAIQVPFELIDGQEKEVVFRLGAGNNASDAQRLVHECKGVDFARSALEKVRQYWDETLGTVQVQTPDKALNILFNSWLMYQSMACRLWARSGYYQSGGAYGFRDQLQDVLAIMYTKPEIARAQILLCASRQFEEGDVQHWWHPPTGRGVRTTCSDDYLWLPYVTAKYIQYTGDAGVLDQQVPFLTGRPLNPGEESYYDMFHHTAKTGTLYQHCVLAIQNGLKFGSHNLPLMGSGDWNDGMDKVGQHGKGESIWLAFFLYDVLQHFTSTATEYNDAAFAKSCADQAQELKTNINNNGWDGRWYRRAYFDDGTPLGSASNDECSIDSISQSWSILSGAGYKERSAMAMNAVYDRLADKENRLIQLLDPPFNKSKLDPGYIKGYVPGVRENGGQYSHAAIWTVMAFAAMGDNDRTWELLDMVNPINHGKTNEDVAQYCVEPYVMAADVYKLPSHMGRGGWTWYTGSAGWMYQCILQSFLGIKQVGDKLLFNPCLPTDWDDCIIDYKYETATYHIVIRCRSLSNRRISVKLDGDAQQGNNVVMINDGKVHEVEVG